MRRSLAADDLIILPQKRFFVKHFFEKLLKFFELKSFSSFSVLTGTFESKRTRNPLRDPEQSGYFETGEGKLRKKKPKHAKRGNERQKL